MTDFIVDASVVGKWLLEETGSSQARSLIASQRYLRAPDLIVPELANVLWKKTVRKEISYDEMRVTLEKLLHDYIDVAVRLLPARILVKLALNIAHSEKQTAYDSLYLAAAIQARCQLVTADERFVRSIKSPILKPHIISLGDAALRL